MPADRGRLAELFCSRFPNIDKIHSLETGARANLLAIALIKAHTNRVTILVFKGGYHEGLTSSGPGQDREVELNTMFVPHKLVAAPYNDIEALEMTVEEHKNDLACILLEPMQVSPSCLLADLEFIKATRAKATEVGAVLMLDESTTSRMSVGGLQSLL